MLPSRGDRAAVACVIAALLALVTQQLVGTVLVTTDVIGHGINLPLADVVFAETTKFDGRCKRPLALWEAAQVAGRAGRGSPSV